MTDPYSLVISDEEKNAALLKIAEDIREWYRRNPDQAPARATDTEEN